MQWYDVNFYPEDPCCYGNQPFLFKDKIGCSLTRASNAKTQLLGYSVAVGQMSRSTERISSWSSEILLLVGKFLAQNCKICGWKPPFFRKFRDTIEILSNSHNFICGKLAVFVGKIQLRVSPTFNRRCTPLHVMYVASYAWFDCSLSSVSLLIDEWKNKIGLWGYAYRFYPMGLQRFGKG